MKTRSFFIAILLGSVLGLQAQLPNPLDFNTATNASHTGVISVGSNDLHWTSSSNYAGPYGSPVRCNPVAGWVTSPYPNADWITHPHTCTTGVPNEHHCLGDVDEYYKLTFTLPSQVCGQPVTNPNAYCLSMDYYADNSVYEIYVNGSLDYVNSGFTLPYNSNNSFGSGQQSSVTLCNHWVAGSNEIIVHVRSGAPTYPGYTGFLTVVNQTATTTEDNCGGTGGCCLGNKCGSTQNKLTSNYEIPLNTYNFNFSGSTSDKVNVGYNCPLSGIGKLNSTTAVRTNFSASSSPESVAIFGDNAYSTTGTGVGVMGIANNRSREGGANLSVGVWGDATGSGDNIGGKFYAGDSKPSAGVHYNIGVSAVARPSTGNPAPYTYISTYPGGANIGVYATGELNNSPDINAPGQDWAAWFDGDVNIVGNCFWNTGFQFSDKRFKKNIKALENVNEKIQKLHGYSYSFRTDEFKEKGFDKRTHLGLIAQEINEVFPELVTKDAKGFYAVDYEGMIPVLLVAAKEQGKTIQQQQQQIDELKTVVQSLATSGATGRSAGLTVTLSDKNSIVLNQNVPNPFAESTVISYNIPSDFTKAQIVFTTDNGNIIRTVDINTKGSGSLTVFANDLSHGIYTYSLVIDGKTIDTKKMVRE